MKNNVIKLVCLFVLLCLSVSVCLTSCKTNPDNTSSGAEASAVNNVSEKEDVSSENEVSSEPEEVVSEPEDSTESKPVQEETATASQTTTNKQTNSQANNKQTGQNTQTQTQPTQQSTQWDGDRDSRDPSWTCPDPAAHGGRANMCLNKIYHDEGIVKYQEQQERINIYYTQGAAKWGMSVEEFKIWVKSHCDRCGRPFGDGHNGTCNGYTDETGHHCVNYD